MQEITAWLANPDYSTGVKLYHQYGQSNFLKLKFSAGPLPGNAERLRTELQKLLPAVPVTPISKKVTLPDLPPPPVKTSTAGADNLKYLQLLKRRDRLYLELNELMAQKHFLPEGPELCDCALLILAKHQQLGETWSQIDHYQEHQAFPVIPQEPKAPIDLEKEIQQLRVSISKANTRLKKTNCRNRDKTRQTLQASEARLAQLLATRNSHE